MALTDNLIFYHKHEEASGTRADSHGGHDLAEVGGTVNGTTGKIDNGSAFVGGASMPFLRAPDHAELDFTDEMSLQAWIFPTTESTGAIFVKGDFDGVLTIWMRRQTANMQIWLSNSILGTATNCFPDIDVWYHVVVVFDGNGSTNADRLKLYVNNVEQSLSFTGTIPATLTNSSVGLSLGLESGWEGFAGTIDETAGWARALTSTEVGTLYNAGDGLSYDDFGGGGGGVTVPALDEGMLTGGLMNMSGGLA